LIAENLLLSKPSHAQFAKPSTQFPAVGQATLTETVWQSLAMAVGKGSPITLLVFGVLRMQYLANKEYLS